MIRKYCVLLYFYTFIFLFSCNEKADLPNLNVNPLIQIYKSNRIDYIIKSTCWNDSLVNKDSIKLNNEGLTTYFCKLHGWRIEEHYQYDSLNRVVEKRHSSDIRFKVNMTYKTNIKQHEILQYQDNNTISYFKFDKSFKNLESEVHLNLTSKDTIVFSKYNYQDDRIISIIENHVQDGWKKETFYLYDKNGKLKIIKDGAETIYLSPNTGLIDLARKGSDKISYQYFKMASS